MEAVGRFQIPRKTLEGRVGDMGAGIAHAYVERWENMADDDPWLALVRSSFSHEGSYQLLRSELEAQQTVPLREVLGSTGEGPLRSAMVECLIAGMIMARYIYRLEPAGTLPAAAFEAAFASSLQQAINGALPAVDDQPPMSSTARPPDPSGPEGVHEREQRRSSGARSRSRSEHS